MNKHYQQHERWINDFIQDSSDVSFSPSDLPLNLLEAFATELEDIQSPYSELAIRLMIRLSVTESSKQQPLCLSLYESFKSFHRACQFECRYRRQWVKRRNIIPFPYQRVTT